MSSDDVLAGGDFDRFDDFLERPVLSLDEAQPAFSPGEQLADRFLIAELLGRGGMGEVYRAFDLELDTVVALKTLPVHLATSEESVERFKREVLQARRISHPNVCRVFDLFLHNRAPAHAVPFLTMAFIEGVTLSQRMAASPLSRADALLIASQIASAIDAAHSCGVIHRDLKPSNVMIATSETTPRALVTDFGLAVPVDCRTDNLRRPLSLGGTAPYAAPEQYVGNGVGPAADIHAFGVLLHELLTGELPELTPADEPRLSRTLGRRWAQVIRSCVAEDPARRPRTAAAALVMASRPPGVIPVAATALVLIALAMGWWRYQFETTRPPLANDLVVAEIANATGEDELSAVTELFRRQIEQSPFVTVLTSQQLQESLRSAGQAPNAEISVTIGRELLRLRPDAFLSSGYLRRSGGGYVLTVRLETARNSMSQRLRSWARSYEARDRTELREAVQRGASWIRATIGEGSDEIPKHDRAADEVTTNSWRALDLYADAESLFAGQRIQDGLALLEEAVRIDPDFAAAWMRMGDVLMSRREYEDAYVRWQRALEVVNRRKLGTREAFRIRGMFASDTHDFAEAERVYRLYLLSYPNDFAPYFYIARPLLMLGRPHDAIEMLQLAAQRNPTLFSIPAQLAMHHLRLQQWDRAAVQLDKLREMGRADWADCIQGQIAFLRGDFARAFDAFDNLSVSDDATLRMRAPMLQASLLADLGRAEPAIAHLEPVTRPNRGLDPANRADAFLAIGFLRLQIGDREACRDMCLLAEQIDNSPVRLARAATLLARAGFPRDAERLLEKLSPSSPSRRVRADRDRIRGEIALARGQNREALALFRVAATLEADGVHLEYLARGAAAAGEIGLATRIYEQIVRDAAYYWRYPDSDFPGTWFSSVQAYLRLPDNSARTEVYHEALEKIRLLKKVGLPANALTP
jgi:eukaryotic-like serine/threonine-protein kinase